jgi:tetratricopeptide (TPR) repeat protein
LEGWMLKVKAKHLGGMIGWAVAGPAGMIAGEALASLLPASFPALPEFVRNVLVDLTGDVIEAGGARIARRLLEDRDAIWVNQDLQDALREALALAVERTRHEFYETPDGSRYCDDDRTEAGRFIRYNPLPEDVKHLLPPEGWDIRNYLDDPNAPRRFWEERLEGMMRDAPWEAYGYVRFLRRNLWTNTIQAFGELLKRKDHTPAWRAFVRLNLEGQRELLRELATGQEEFLNRLNELLPPAKVAELVESLAKRVEEGFTAVLRELEEVREEITKLTFLVTEVGADVAAIRRNLDEVASYVRGLRPWVGMRLEGRALAVEAPSVTAPLRERFLALLEEHTAIFGGRDEEMARLRGFVASGKGGYLFVTGPSGYGKTALLANFVAPAFERYAFYFFSFAHGFRGREDFLRTVCEQLLAYYRLNYDRLPERADRLEAVFIRLLRMPLVREGEPLVVVVDAVDEAEDMRFLRNLFLPELPAGKVVIFSARETGEDWPGKLGLNGKVEVLRLGRMGPEKVREVLLVAGGKAAKWAADDALVRQVHRVSEGDPFYLRLLAEDVLEGKLTPAEISRRPSGLDAYLGSWWEEVMQAARVEDVRDLLGTLMVALGPIGRDDLLRLYPGMEWAFDEVLGMVRRYVVGTEEAGYALCHPRFQEYLAGRKLKGQAARYRERLLGYCSRWAEHRSPYAFAHYAAHLKEAGRTGELYALVEDRGWYEASCAYDPSRRSFVADVERALSVAEGEGLHGLPKVSAYSLLYATLGSLATAISPKALGVLVQLSEAERALRYAELMVDPMRQIGAYLEIAKALLGRGEREEAREAFQLALSTAREIEDAFWKAKALSEIAIALAKAGQFELALSTAREIEVAWGKAEALSEIAIALAKAGDISKARETLELALSTAREIEVAWGKAEALSEIAIALAKAGDISKARETLELALSTAREIEDARDKAMALSEIAIALTKAGQFELAMSTAREIEDARDKAMALSEIAIALAKAGQFELALSTAREIEVAFWKAMALSEIAIALAKAGDISKARETLELALSIAREIEDAWRKAEALSEIAIALAKVGKFELALSTAREIEDTWERARALSEVAAALAKAGKFELALSTAREIEDARRKAEAISEVAAALAKAGKFELALSTAREIEDAFWKAEAISEVAAALAKAGDIPRARETLKLAMSTAREIEDARRKAEAISEIAAALAKASKFELALSTAREIEDAFWKAEAISEVAAALAKAGDIPRAKETLKLAMSTAREIEDTWERARALSEIAAALAKAGKFELAMSTAREIEDTWERARALSEIAAALAKAGDIPKARETLKLAMSTAREIEDTWERARALSEIAAALAKAGKFELALSTAREIEDARRKAEALSEIAAALAKAGKFELALSTAWEIEVAFWKAKALSEIAAALAKAGQFELALSTAREMVFPWDKAKALSEVAAALAKAGNMSGAIALCRDAFRSAREKGRDSAWAHIGALVSAFVALGADVGEMWERIQAVEGLFRE